MYIVESLKKHWHFIPLLSGIAVTFTFGLFLSTSLTASILMLSLGSVLFCLLVIEAILEIYLHLMRLQKIKTHLRKLKL